MYDYLKLPEHMRGGTRRYIEQGIIPGDFLQGVISNDLSRAAGAADDINRDLLYFWAGWFYNEAPSQSFGSPQKMAAWAEHRGLEGLKETHENAG